MDIASKTPSETVVYSCLSVVSATLLPIGVRHRPGNRAPSRNSFIRPCLTSFLPVHFLGSQCSRSHMATGNGNGHSFTVSANSRSSDHWQVKLPGNSFRSNLSHRFPYLIPQTPCFSSGGIAAPCRERNAAFFPTIYSYPSFYVPTFFRCLGRTA